jgi:hypothetical protein
LAAHVFVQYSGEAHVLQKCPDCEAPVPATIRGLIPEAPKNVQMTGKIPGHYKSERLLGVGLCVLGL